MTDEKNLQPPPEPMESGVPTLGGRQLWGDTQFFHGWKIQQNVLTTHYRLLDSEDGRHHAGSQKACQQALAKITQHQKLPPMTGDVVILVHGIGRSSKSFSKMKKALEADGKVVVPFDYPSTRATIPKSAEYLHSVIQSMPAVKSIRFVGHSMGGLVLRSLIQQFPDSGRRIQRAVMLGVPNRGARMADMLKKNPLFKAVLGPAGQQLSSDTEGLIAKLPTPEFEFGVLAGGRSAQRGFSPLIPGDNDVTVSVHSTRLPGAADFILLPVIHSFLMTDSRAIEATLNFLNHGAFRNNGQRTPILATEIIAVEDPS